jgi:hypothetical protein
MSLRPAVLILAGIAGLVLFILLVPLTAEAQRAAYGWITPLAAQRRDEPDKALTVTYHDGLLTVRCTNAALTEVFGRLEATTGLDVVFHRGKERACRSTRIEGQPLDWALDRFLADHGLSYVLVLDRQQDIVAVRIFDDGERVRPTVPRQPRAPLRY